MPAHRARPSQTLSPDAVYSHDAQPTFNIITPTPRALTFPAIEIPVYEAVNHLTLSSSPHSSPSLSPYSSPEPSTDYASAHSPYTPHSSLPRRFDSPESSSSAQFSPSISNEVNFALPITNPKAAARLRAGPPPKKGDPLYIPRPENAFILFRKDAVAKMRAAQAIASPDSEDGRVKGKKQRQADMSKSISKMWKELPPDERGRWEEMAAKIKREHEAKHPDYRYQPARPGSKPKGKGKSDRPILKRKKTAAEDEEEFVEVGGMSEDLAVVVRATRGPRRASTSTFASTSSSQPPQSQTQSSEGILLPSLFPASRSPSPRARSPLRGKMICQPLAMDPSPPPTQLFFPLRADHSRTMSLDMGYSHSHSHPGQQGQQPAMHVQEVFSSGHYNQMSSPQYESTYNDVFTEPMTVETNPWSPTSHPVSHPSISSPVAHRALASQNQGRARALSLPQPDSLSRFSSLPLSAQSISQTHTPPPTRPSLNRWQSALPLPLPLSINTSPSIYGGGGEAGSVSGSGSGPESPWSSASSPMPISADSLPHHPSHEPTPDSPLANYSTNTGVAYPSCLPTQTNPYEYSMNTIGGGVGGDEWMGMVTSPDLRELRELEGYIFEMGGAS